MSSDSPDKIRCEICSGHPGDFLCSLTGKLADRLYDEKTVKEFSTGEKLFVENQAADAVYCIHQGQVKLYKTGELGANQVIRLLGSGDVVGYRPVVADEPYAATAEAIENTIACVIQKALLLDLIQKEPDFALKLMAKLARELRLSEEQLVRQSQHTVKQRAAELLLFLLDRSDHGDPATREIKVPLLRTEMAQMVGTTPESISRTLREFARSGIIDLTRSTIAINSTDSLKRIARRYS